MTHTISENMSVHPSVRPSVRPYASYVVRIIFGTKHHCGYNFSSGYIPTKHWLYFSSEGPSEYTGINLIKCIPTSSDGARSSVSESDARWLQQRLQQLAASSGDWRTRSITGKGKISAASSGSGDRLHMARTICIDQQLHQLQSVSFLLLVYVHYMQSWLPCLGQLYDCMYQITGQ